MLKIIRRHQHAWVINLQIISRSAREFALQNLTQTSKWRKKMSQCQRVLAKRSVRLVPLTTRPTFSIWHPKRAPSDSERFLTHSLPKSLETTRTMACWLRRSRLVQCAKIWMCVWEGAPVASQPKLTCASCNWRKKSGNLRYKWLKRPWLSCRSTIWKVTLRPSHSTASLCKQTIC